jgi:hypothetical protein
MSQTSFFIMEVLFHHGISAYLLVCCLLKVVRLEIYDVAHHCHVVWKLLHRLSLSKRTPRSLDILLGIPQCLSEPSRFLNKSGRGIVSPSSPEGCCIASEVTSDSGSTFGASYSKSFVARIGSWNFLDVKSSSNFTSLLTIVFLCSGI